VAEKRSRPGEEDSAAGNVVVNTRASSGIGRTTAHRSARERARLVLAARSAESLQDVAAEHAARAVLPHFQSRSGTLVIIASVYSRVTYPCISP
jgi:NADP-dependent 3-hydroxy acid dehydrogenase YdfG